MATATAEKPADSKKEEEGVKMVFGTAGQITFKAIADGVDVSRNKRTIDGLLRGDYVELREGKEEGSRDTGDYKLTPTGRAYLKAATEAGLTFEEVPAEED